MEKIPQDLGAERAVLCASMSSTNAAIRAYELLKVEDFYDSRHKIIFNSLTDIVTSGASIPDLVLVTGYLETNGWLDEAGGYGYVASITDSLPDSGNIEHYCRLVKESSIKRAFMSLGHKIITSLNSNSSELIDMVSQAVLNIGNDPSQSGPVRAQDAAGREIERIRTLRAEGRSELKPTGITGLDNLLGGGLENGQLFVLAALTAVGKTSLALQIATNLASKNYRVLYHSLEMSEAQLVRRILCGQTGIKPGRMKYGMMNDAGGVNALDTATTTMGVWPLFLDERSTVSLNDIRSSARRLQINKGLDCIVVDYLQLVRPPKAENRVQQVSAISRGLKLIAKELKVPVIALSQLTREGDRRQIESRQSNSKTVFRHHLSELRESGSIEQDADIVAFIIRDIRPTLPWDDSNTRPTILQIAKHRDGPLAEIQMEFNPDYANFCESKTTIKENTYGASQREGRENEGGGSEPPQENASNS